MPFGLDFSLGSEDQAGLLFLPLLEKFFSADAKIFAKAGAKVRLFQEPTKFFHDFFPEK